MNDPPKVYLTRAGRGGEDEGYALEEALAIIGFRDVASLEEAQDYDEVFKLVTEATRDAKPRAVGNRAGQRSAFALAMNEGDIVVLPRKLTSQMLVAGEPGE